MSDFMEKQGATSLLAAMLRPRPNSSAMPALVPMAQTATPSTPAPADHAVTQSAKAVEHQSRKVADNAQDIKHFLCSDRGFGRANHSLAADHTLLAAERTYAAWVRTGLFALASGV